MLPAVFNSCGYICAKPSLFPAGWLFSGFASFGVFLGFYFSSRHQSPQLTVHKMPRPSPATATLHAGFFFPVDDKNMA
jgi:hypothetical protein